MLRSMGQRLEVGRRVDEGVEQQYQPWTAAQGLWSGENNKSS